MNETKMSTRLHHLVGRDNRIVTAGQQASYSSGGIWRQSASTGNLLCIDKQRTRRDFDMAGHVRILQLHPRATSRFPQLILQKAADSPLNFHAGAAETLVATPRAHRKIFKRKWRKLIPSRVAQRAHIPLHGHGYRIIGDAEDSLDSFNRRSDRSPVAKPNEKTVARLFDSLHGNSLKALPKCREQFAKEKATVAALQPKLVVVDDDDGSFHAGWDFPQHRGLIFALSDPRRVIEERCYQNQLCCIRCLESGVRGRQEHVEPARLGRVLSYCE